MGRRRRRRGRRRASTSSSGRLAARWLAAPLALPAGPPVEVAGEAAVRGTSQRLVQGPHLLRAVGGRPRRERLLQHLPVQEQLQRPPSLHGTEHFADSGEGFSQRPSADAPLQQRAEDAPVWPGPLAGQLLQHTRRQAVVPALRAGPQQRGVDVGADLQAIAPGEVLDLRQGVAHAAGADQQLRHDRERVLGGGHALLLHPSQELHPVVHEALLGAGVQQGVVEDLVGLEAGVGPHLLHHLEGRLHVAPEAVALGQPRPSAHSWRETLRLHLRKEHIHPVHEAALREGPHDAVVRGHRRLQAAHAHLPVDLPDLLSLLLHGEALDQRVVDHCVHALAVAPGLQAADEVAGRVHLTVQHELLHHASGRHNCRPDAVGDHGVPHLPHALHVLGVPVRTDQRPTSLRAPDRALVLV
mmetsp:Transcript_80708/g.237176  ORF Transcript_80708/g.237176 Transcript_80708/m.237176 type:complete len:413 (+) Transcript_80708:103-1341(+)